MVRRVRVETRDCQRCSANNKMGHQCARRTCKIADVCWQHLRSDYHLQVKQSGIPGAGLGLFTTQDIKVPRGGQPKRIIQYSRENQYMHRMTKAEIDERYGNGIGVYVWCKNDRECYDAKSTMSTNARRANACDRPRHRRQCNAKINRNGWLVAIKNMKKGQEIFVSYGPDYWI